VRKAVVPEDDEKEENPYSDPNFPDVSDLLPLYVL